ncbi:MAG: hypothetical protein ACRCUY_05950 [Thermoguttaceae bacterium]
MKSFFLFFATKNKAKLISANNTPHFRGGIPDQGGVVRTHQQTGTRPCFAVFIVLLFLIVCGFVSPLHSQSPTRGSMTPIYTYVPRNESKPGDQMVVTLTATSAKQAMLNAQLYYYEWDVVDAWEGQSRVMYEVLLKKRPAYIRGTVRQIRTLPNKSR